jgi:hypothetical protein
MNSIKYACSLNNQGVDLLVAGDSVSALEFLQSAQKLLKEALFELETVTTSCSGVTLSNEGATLPFFESPAALPGLEDTEFYIYHHGIHMITNTTNGVITRESEEMLSLYNAIVLFNLALAFHHDGSLGREQSLKTAALLYGMTVQLLARSNNPDDISATILTLLALNNKAQIHYDQCEYIQSIDCMLIVSEIILDSADGLRSALNPKDVEGLMLNIILMNAPTAAPAA